MSDQTHAKLTVVVGQLTTKTGRIQPYEEAILALLKRTESLPAELLKEIQEFLEKNKHLGYITREDFLKDAIRFRIEYLSKGKQPLTA